MKKKLLLSLAAVVAIAIGVVGFSAFEAHVVNVTATITNATTVNTTSLSYGTVFPQEVLIEPVTIALSESFANTGAIGVDYKIKQKPKCVNDAGLYASVIGEDANGNFICPDTYSPLPLLCPFLSKTSPKTSDTSIPSFHGPIDLALWTNAVSETWKAIGHLTQNDPSTTWGIDLHVPCFRGQCGQDWDTYVHTANPQADPNAYLIDPALNGKILGCDLWYEVIGVVRQPT